MVLAPQEEDGGHHQEDKQEKGKEGASPQRRLFLEFYGPLVGLFLRMGWSNRTAELLTVVATQLCPLLAASPLLRLNMRTVVSSGNTGSCLGFGVRVSHAIKVLPTGAFALPFSVVFFQCKFERYQGNTDSSCFVSAG